MENYILQNNALDIYENYFSGVPRDPEMEIPSARAINRFWFVLLTRQEFLGDGMGLGNA